MFRFCSFSNRLKGSSDGNGAGVVWVVVEPSRTNGVRTRMHTGEMAENDVDGPFALTTPVSFIIYIYYYGLQSDMAFGLAMATGLFGAITIA